MVKIISFDHCLEHRNKSRNELLYKIFVTLGPKTCINT